MNRQNANFVTSAVEPKGFPDSQLPEIAFVGRSNVGKSSLLNALLQRKTLAKVSGKPGKTRTINFFEIDQKFAFVDLPGYGYASVSKDMKKNWALTIETYLRDRVQLRLTVLLVDLRHPPTKDDQLMLEWLKNYQKAFVVVATKTDKIPKSKVQRHLNSLSQAFSIRKQQIIAYSSATKLGVESVWDHIMNYSLEG